MKTKETKFIVYNHSQQLQGLAWSDVFDTREQAEKYVINGNDFHSYEIMECDDEGEPL